MTFYKNIASSLLDQTRYESILQILDTIMPSLWVLLELYLGRRMCSFLCVSIHAHIMALILLYYNYLFT